MQLNIISIVCAAPHGSSAGVVVGWWKLLFSSIDMMDDDGGGGRRRNGRSGWHGGRAKGCKGRATSLTVGGAKFLRLAPCSEGETRVEMMIGCSLVGWMGECLL